MTVPVSFSNVNGSLLRYARQLEVLVHPRAHVLHRMWAQLLAVAHDARSSTALVWTGNGGEVATETQADLAVVSGVSKRMPRHWSYSAALVHKFRATLLLRPAQR